MIFKHTTANTWLKLIVIIVLFISIMVCTSATHAWLYHEPDAKVIKLTGSNLTLDISDITATKQLIPGNSYDVKPYVTVPTSNTIDSYIFIKVSGSSTYFTYTVDTGIWKNYSANTAYYYTTVTKNTGSSQDFDILTNDIVTIPSGLTLSNTGSDQKITITACAVQNIGGITLPQAYSAANSVLG